MRPPSGIFSISGVCILSTHVRMWRMLIRHRRTRVSESKQTTICENRGVESPAKLVVKDQKAVAEVVWSSPNYDYMKVGEEKFLPVNQGGETSVFEIPVTVFDRKMAVAADTTAMSTPHEIEYTLLFDSASIKTE